MTSHPLHFPDGTPDRRYSIQHEYTGHISGKPQYVLRYCDDYIASSKSYSAMVVRAAVLREQHQGALIIEEKTE